MALVQFMLNMFYHHKSAHVLLLFLFQYNGRKRRIEKIVDVQLQEGKVAIAVIGLVLALLGDIFLEGRGDLGVVSVETVEDGLDVFRPVGRVVEGNHGCDVREERPLNKPAATLSSNLNRRTSATSSLGTV